MDIGELHTRCGECRGYRSRHSGERRGWHDRLDAAQAEFMKARGLDGEDPAAVKAWHYSDEFIAASPSEEEIDADQVPCVGCEGVGYHLTYEGEQLVRFMRTHGFIQAER